MYCHVVSSALSHTPLPPRSTLGVVAASTFALATIMYAEELSSEEVVLVALALALASTLLVLVVLALTVSSALTGTLFGPDPVLSVLLEEKV